MNTPLRTLLCEWKDRKLPSVIARDTHIDLTPQQGTRNATVITGFRRTGKTYLVYEAIEKLLQTHSKEEVVYINFEDERIPIPTTDMVTDLIPEIQAVFGQKPKYLFLDELQLIPNWSKWVRRILDTEEIDIFITGSSSKMSSAELPTEMRGRALETKVYPLTFKEFARFKGESIDFEKLKYVKEEAARFSHLFDEYLLFGGLPAVVLTTPEKKQELLQSYFQTVVQKDIAERHKIDNDTALKTLLKLLLNSNYITITKLANSLKSMGIPVGKTTVDNFLDFIKTAYFMRQLSIHSPVVINQLQYPRKVYFIDTGFITALSTKFSKDLGRLFENLVFYKLFKENDTLHYYRDDRGNEVDFAILENEQTSALYQACFDLSDEETRKREIQSLIKAGAALNCSNLYLVTLEKPEILELPDGVELITAAGFL